MKGIESPGDLAFSPEFSGCRALLPGPKGTLPGSRAKKFKGSEKEISVFVD